MLLEDPDLYAVTFLELFALDDFDFTSATRKELFENCITDVIAESVLAELTNSYDSYGLTTKTGMEVKGCNTDEPLSQAIHLPRAATYCW